MGIISTIKSVLGLEQPDREHRETNVTVEREPDASSERAVKEPDEDPSTDVGSVSTETSDSTASEESSTEGATADVGDGEPVSDVKGIGPAYAGRLEQAGVQTVADLANADAEELAASTDIAATRIENWIERARSRTN